ncbi:MAG: helix-turn-helix transcriptional regulator [Verrucomicrobiota bacterium]
MQSSEISEVASVTRRRMGLNQSQMAQRLSIDRTYLSSIETGRKVPSDPLTERILVLAQSANVDLPETLKERVSEMAARYGFTRARTEDPMQVGPRGEPTRANIELIVRDYLDAAEAASGGLGHAYHKLRKVCDPADFE